MNPSSSGWIIKYGSLVKNNVGAYPDFRSLYVGMKKTGFVYGINTQIPKFIAPEYRLTEDENAKINLLNTLYYTFTLETQETDFSIFLDSVFEFYKNLGVNHMSFWGKLLSGKNTATKLEKLFDSRVYLEDNVISKTFNNIITNSLLFVDILLFKRYLTQPKAIRKYGQQLEYIAINVTCHALNSKEKNQSDKRLQQLLESSLTFIDSSQDNFDGAYREKLLNNCSLWENNYFLDMACLTVWEDTSLDYQESEFIFAIGKDLGFSKKQIGCSLEEITSFFAKNSACIPFLKGKNLAIQFYDSMAKIVNKLILRNSKRLQKELSESRELVYLISKSATKDLSPEERKKVQNQLIDIFKSVPSLAIFLLPGGAVLLPIFIKLIPKLLPSSFDENRVEKE